MKQTTIYTTILKAFALILFIAGLFAFNTPIQRAYANPPKEFLLFQLPDSLLKSVKDSLASMQDSTTAVLQDSLNALLPDSTTLALRDSLLKAAADSAANAALIREDSLTIAKIDSLKSVGEKKWAKELIDSLNFDDSYKNALAKAKELKRLQRDTILQRKDSVIRATPRLLDTYLFTDTIKNQRIFAWTTDGYFNKPEEVKLDTTFNSNFNELPYKKNDVNAVYLGTAGSAMMYYNYFLREESQLFPFFTPYMPYTYTMETMPFYNTKTPYTELAYWGTLFAAKPKEETNVKFLHTQNFTPSFNFSFLYKREGASGMLEHEKTDHRTFAITGNYIGKRYVAQGGYIFNRVKRNENGGVADLSMVLDTIIDAKTIPVALKEATTAIKRNTLFLTHSYGIPFNFLKKGTTADSTLTPKDSTLSSSVVDNSDIENANDSLIVNKPSYGEGTMAYIGHTFEYSIYTKAYKDAIALDDQVARELYNNAFYINPTVTADSARVMNLENRFYLRLQPWAKEAIISKIDAGIGFQYLNIYNFSPTYFLSGNQNSSDHNLYLYFGASGVLKKYFAWDGFGKYTFSGYNQNDFNIGGKVRFSAYPLPKGIHLTGKLNVSLQRPNFYFNNYYSNHYIWNNDFDKTSETRIEAKLEIPDYKMELFFGYSLLNNNIYLDSLANAQQNNEAMSVITAYAKKDFKAGLFHFDHKVLFQISSKEEIIPLPKLALNLRYYIEAPLVKNVLTAQLGVEATFNTKYKAPGYSPALGMFYNQSDEETGENPYLDVFVNMQWKRASIFIKYVNAAQDWPTSDYFSANRYIRPQKALKFGIHWPFYVK